MSQADKLYRNYFLEYASYVVRDRAIPDLIDGFKPVQRRIMHTLFETDDGRFIKVANVVGNCMKYHPHGDSSIYQALVNLANCGLFIETQGNFGNFLTGDGAAASRYIECRLKPFAKKVMYNPEITEYVDSYDGRNKEPVVFQAKIPIVAIQGTVGIAVGMSTQILPHNLLEVLEAQKKALRGEKFEIYPDFPGGGIMDVSEYNDGLGKVAVRARFNASDPKKLVIEDLPYGVTSDALIESIEKANATGQLKIASINDYTAKKAQIEICWQRNVYSEDMIPVLYATTDCEKKISVNPLVIVDGLPKAVPISEMIRFHAEHLVEVLTKELENDKRHLLEKLRARTLERIFIEERIYKSIEDKKSQEEVRNAIIENFDPLPSRHDRGALWENFFFMERVKLHSLLQDFCRIYFWRTSGKKTNELDFIEVIDGKMQAFECKLSPKAKAKPGPDFEAAYPDCPIHVASPATMLKVWLEAQSDAEAAKDAQ